MVSMYFTQSITFWYANVFVFVWYIQINILINASFGEFVVNLIYNFS